MFCREKEGVSARSSKQTTIVVFQPSTSEAMTMQCSDLSHPQENLQWVKRLSDTEYLNDALIVAGPSMAIAYHVYTGGIAS